MDVVGVQPFRRARRSLASQRGDQWGDPEQLIASVGTLQGHPGVPASFFPNQGGWARSLWLPRLTACMASRAARRLSCSLICDRIV